MSTSEWAKREVEIACKKERGDKSEDEWGDITDETDRQEDYKKYRSRRMNSLTKKVYKDGTVKYSDTNRFTFYDLNANPNIGFFSGLASSVVNEMFPIEMPYAPEDKSIKVYIREFLTDRKNGDFDTVSILYAVFPNGERKEINRYFKESEEDWEEIRIDECSERVRMHYKRERKERGNDV
jgi:hypothetical protein